MAGAFQSDAFQNNAFQVEEYPPLVPPDPPLFGSYDLTAMITITIDEVQYTYHLTTLNIQEQLSGRNTLNVEVQSINADLRPSVDEEIIIAVGGVRKFGGIIEDYTETGIGAESAGPGLQFDIYASDFNSYPDRRIVNTIAPAGTLKSQLEFLLPNLTAFGVTLDPAQADGPTMPAVGLPFLTLTEAFNRLCEIAAPLLLQAVVWEIDYNKVLRMFGVLDGFHSASFSITDSNAAEFILGDVSISPDLKDYASTVFVAYGSGIAEQVDTLGVGDGVTSVFALHLPPVTLHGYVNVGGTLSGTTITGGTNESLGVASESPTWVYDSVTNTATRTSAPSPGDTILCPYEAQFPGLVSATVSVPVENYRERLYEKPDIFDVVQAQAVADGLVVQSSIRFEELEYDTHESGLHPGQVQTVTLTKHDISGELFLLTNVECTDYKESVFTYTVKAVAGSTATPENWMRTYENWSRGLGGGSGATTVIAGTTGSPRPAYFLGGSEALYIQDPTPTWKAADAVRVTIDTTIRQSVYGVVYCRLRATSGTVTARLRNLTDATTAGTSVIVSTDFWVDADFSVILTPGVKVYALELLPSLANTDVAGVGTFI